MKKSFNLHFQFVIVGVLVFDLLILVVGFFAGMTASVTGFGIGSFLIPLVSVQTGTKVAIALVSLPHFLGTSLRFWLLKTKINRRIFIRFGLLSAAGGLIGAFLHIFLSATYCKSSLPS